MNQLTIFEKNGSLWTSSCEIAVMIDKRHDHLVRDIRGYVEAMKKATAPKIGDSAVELKIEPNEFFLESSYKDSTGRTLPCFDISKKGCEFVANKLTGEKGVLFTAAYVNQFNDYEKALAAPRTIPQERLMRAKAMLINAKHRAAQDYRKLYEAAGIKPEYQIMALQDFIGDDGPRLPPKALESTKITFDKGTIAKRLGVFSKSGLAHAQAIGAIIRTLKIEPEETEKVPFMRNGHDDFDIQYTASVIDKVRVWLEERHNPNPISVGGKNYQVNYRI